MSKMISVAPGFQYSVNIGYDLNQDDKLKNFIPTKSALELLRDILESTDTSSTERARVVVGAYGKGKSHIMLAILSVLMRKNWSLFSKLREKVALDPELNHLISNYYESGKRLLPVIINGSNTSIQQAFLQSLQKALAENDLMGVMPDTNYKAAISVIRKWEKEYPDTYASFKAVIGKPVDVFIGELEDYEIETYSIFEKLYPTLTSGSLFNPFLGFDTAELYESVAKSLKPYGYDGIFVVYDEFSKFLEANIQHASVSDTKMLQDFAEKCNRSGEVQLHIMLISHKEISNYIDNLPKQKVDGWRGVSERFKHIHLNNNFSQTYEIISTVIIKSSGWEKFQNAYHESFDSLLDTYGTHPIFSDLTKEECEQTIHSCYPLHPVTTFILPRLSERVAQNERTLFTFLSSKGISTLPSFLDTYNDDCFQVITPDMVYDYFEPLFRKESYASGLHKNYMLTRSILEKLDENTLEAKIIKTLSLIYTLEQYEKIKPTEDEIVEIYSLDYARDAIRDAINNLINKDYVVYLKQSNKFLRLKKSSGVDIGQQIADEIERGANRFSVKASLNAASLDNYMYPSRYNDDREMTRYFSFEFIESSEVRENTDWNVKSESIVADGVIYGVIPESEESISKIKDLLVSTSKGYERFIFVVPNKFMDIQDIVRKFNAVASLRTASEGNDLLFDEYEVIYEDLREVISTYIGSYTHPEYYKSTYIHNGACHSITRKANLTGLMSTICEKVYSRTPIVNNEAINRNELTGTAYSSRSKIITALLRNTLEENLGLTGNGQEVSMMRSTLIRRNVLVNENGITKINLHTGDGNFDYMLNVIITFIQGAKRSGDASFDQLYDHLMSPESSIGLRKSLVLIYLAAVLHEYRQEAVIVGSTEQVPLSLDTLLQIEANPAMFHLRYLDWDEYKEKYTQDLDELFSDYIVEAEKQVNSYDYIASAMKRWYLSLPKYSKEKEPEKSEKRYKSLIRLLKQDLGGYDLLFEKLPAAFKQEKIDASLIGDIKLAKEYYDTALSNLIDSLIMNVKKTFSSGTGRSLSNRSSLASVIKDWCDGLDPAVFDHLFENGADRCLRLFKNVSNDERDFIAKLAKAVTDLRIDDWNDRTVEQFTKKLSDFKETAEEFSSDKKEEVNGNTSEYSLVYIDENGKSVTKRFNKVEQTKRGKLLMNNLLSDIESMGHSITDQEKRQILMEVLKKLC